MLNLKWPSNLLVVTSLLLTEATARANPRVPEAFVGVWAQDGACSQRQKTLTISSEGTLAFARSRPEKVVFFANDDGNGHGALHWAAEGAVDNFVLVTTSGPLLYNVNGYGEPGQVVYKACPNRR